MITLSAEEAGLALGTPPLCAPVIGVSIDSRSLVPGDLFVALRGERFDGHDFVAAAFAAGATAAVVERAAWGERREVQGRPIIQVENTLQALSGLARAVRRKTAATVFAVTGSVGKTSTKDVLAAMVGRVRRVAATAANQNNEIGVPLTLLAIEADTEAVIVEMGMRGLGQIAALAAVAEPDIGLITNIHPVHLELLGSLDNIAQAKAELIQGIRSGGAVVVPSKHEVLRPYLRDTSARVIRFSVRGDSCASDVEAWLEKRRGMTGCIIRVRWPDGEAEVETGYLAGYSLENVAAAAAACYAAGLPMPACVEGIAEVRSNRGRGQVLELPGIVLVDDTYNANPAAVRAALEDLIRLAEEGGWRPVAVLGDMLELGRESAMFHRAVGEFAADVGVAALWGVGPCARGFVEGFLAKSKARRAGDVKSALGVAAGHVDCCEETSPIMDGLRPGDVVLFKGSRGMMLERMVDEVAASASAGRWATPGGLLDEGLDEREERKQC